MCHRLVYRPILQRHFLNHGSLFSDNARLCQVDNKTKQDTEERLVVVCITGEIQFIMVQKAAGTWYHPGEREQRENRKGDQAIKPQRPPRVTYFL